MYQYNPDNYSSERKYTPIPVGIHRVRIKDAEPMTSKSGMGMLKFTLEVSGYSAMLFYYLVFNKDAQKITDQKIGELLDSFGLPTNSLPPVGSLIGRVGAAKVKHEMYEGDAKAAISYFVYRKNQTHLPAWSEPGIAAVKSAIQNNNDNNEGLY